MRVMQGTLTIDAVKGEAKRLGIKVGDELVSIGGSPVNAKTWKSTYMATKCPFEIKVLRIGTIVDARRPFAGAAPQSTNAIPVHTGDPFSSIDRTDTRDEKASVPPAASCSVLPMDVTRGNGGNRYNVVTKIVYKKPYGFALKNGTLVVEKAKGQAQKDNVMVGDELISIKGITVEPSTWRAVFLSAQCPFPCVFLVDDPSFDPAKAGPAARLGEPSSFGIGLTLADFDAVRNLDKGTSPEEEDDDPLLSLLREGWGTIKDAKRLFKEGGVENILNLASNPSKVTHLVSRIHKLSQATQTLLKTADQKHSRAGSGGGSAPRPSESKDTPLDVQWTPGTSITELVQKLSDKIAWMQSKATKAMVTVDNMAAALEDDEKGGANPSAEERLALAEAETELGSQLEDLNQVRHLLNAVKKAGLLASASTLAAGQGAGMHNQEESVKQLLGESMRALQDRVGSLARQIKTVGKQLKENAMIVASRKRGDDNKHRSGTEEDHEDDDYDEDMSPTDKTLSLLKSMGKKGAKLLAENKSLIEGGLELLTLAGVVNAKRALAVQKTLSLTVDAVNSKQQLADLVFDTLVSRLPQINIPDIEGYSTEGKAYWYKVTNLSLKHLQVTRNQLKCRMARRVLRIQLSELKMKMEDVGWHFRQESWPRIHAKGKAEGFADGLWLRLMLSLEKYKMTDGRMRWRFSVTRKQVTLSSLKLKISSSSVSWVANTILWLFSDTIRKYVSSEIERGISDKLGQLIEVLNKLIENPIAQDLLRKHKDDKSSTSNSPVFDVKNRSLACDDNTPPLPMSSRPTHERPSPPERPGHSSKPPKLPPRKRRTPPIPKRKTNRMSPASGSSPPPSSPPPPPPRHSVQDPTHSVVAGTPEIVEKPAGAIDLDHKSKDTGNGGDEQKRLEGPMTGNAEAWQGKCAGQVDNDSAIKMDGGDESKSDSTEVSPRVGAAVVLEGSSVNENEIEGLTVVQAEEAKDSAV